LKKIKNILFILLWVTVSFLTLFTFDRNQTEIEVSKPLVSNTEVNIFSKEKNNAYNNGQYFNILDFYRGNKTTEKIPEVKETEGITKPIEIQRLQIIEDFTGRGYFRKETSIFFDDSELIDTLMYDSDIQSEAKDSKKDENLDMANSTAAVQETNNLKEELEKEKIEEPIITGPSTDFKVTAYDLSYDSCNKTPDHPQYGLTASGFDLEGLSRKQAMTIAADPNVLPLGTTVKVEFYEEEYKVFDGTYTVADTGGAIKGDKIDLFLGDFKSQEPHESVLNFGITNAKIKILS